MLKKCKKSFSGYRVTFLSVLDKDKGGIVRILVEGKNAKFANISVFGAKVLYIGWPQGESEFCNDKAVFSICFSRSIKPDFKVRTDRHVVAKMNPNTLESLIRLKNCTFVNPEIDGFYNEIQIKESYPYVPINKSIEGILFSIIVPLYQTDPVFFNDLIASIFSQTYTNYEVILVNSTPDFKPLAEEINKIRDERVRVINLESNYGIVGNTNAGIPYATGDFVMFVDHDDALSPRCLKCYSEEINRYKKENGFYPDLLTCDEDRFESLLERRYRPLFKHSYNEALHISFPYMGHCLTVNRGALDNIELPDLRKEGAQDYDICLKVAELNRRVTNVPEIVYHWREHELSMAAGDDVKPYIASGMKNSLADAYDRRGIDAEAKLTKWTYFYNPKFRDNSTKFEALGFDEFKADLINSQISGSNAKFFLIYDKSYFEDINNIDLHEIIERLKLKNMAVVAPKLVYRDSTNFMAGLAVSEGNIVALNQNFESGVCGGYRGYAECDCNYNAISPHIFALNKDKFTQLGGFREFDNKWLSVIDYCMRANEAGFDVCVTNSLVLGVCGEVSWANLKDPRLITSCRDAVPCVNPGVIWGDDPDATYLGLGKLPDGIPRIKDRLFNKNVDYRTGYAHLKVDVPREVFPEM